MESCDVLIVGGGPAGSSCAWKLRSAGLDVLLLDKAGFPRDKPCAGWITPDVLEDLQIDPEEYSSNRVLQPLAAFRTGLIGGGQLDTRYAATVSYAIRRCQFDHYLLQRSGARLQLAEPVRSIERAGTWWIVNERLKAPLLVAAGGHFCPVARWLGAGRDTGRRLVVARQIEFEMDAVEKARCTVEAEVPEIYFCNDLQGYGWCIRKGEYLNIGLGREDRNQISRHVADFCEYLASQGKIPRHLPGRLRGHAYLLHGPSPRTLMDDGVLAVGDAAGLAYPQSGEGIRPAVESGLIAAEIILSADGDYRRERLEPYRRILAQRFGRCADDRSPRGLLPQGLRRRLGRCLLANRWFVRHVILNQWFLHTRQSPLGAAEE